MKKFLFVVLGLLALPSVASAINIPGAGAINFDFSTAPAASDWSTGATAGASADVGTDAQFDTEVNTGTAGTFGAAIATATGSGTGGSWRYDDVADYIWTRTTGNAASYGMATLNNTSPNFVTDLAVQFTVGEHLAPVAPAEQIPGLRMWYSTNGTAWTPIGNFTAGTHTANVTGLGTNFGNNPMYLLWGDDNADGGADGAYNLDNVTITPTLGGPKAPPTPEFGTQLPPAANTVGAGALDLASSSGGTVLDEGGNSILEVRGSYSALTEQVDLRSLNAGDQVRVGIDIRTFDNSAGSDFELGEDSIDVIAEWSTDGLTFQNLQFVELDGGTPPTAPDTWPVPDDELKPLDTGALGAFTPFTAILPAGAQTVRLRVNAVNTSGSEFFYLDNLRVDVIPIPEPGSVVLVGLGMIGMVGYGIRRRRSA